MQNHEFISEVQSRAGLELNEEIINVVRAVLQILADHLAGNAPAKLAAQLPEEIGALITEYKNDLDAEGEGFGVEEFLSRTTERANLRDSSQAKNYATAVLAVVRKAISEGEFDKMRGTLPAEYDELFGIDSSANLGAGKAN
jgi:uncharacterized protein (DUF2267 family)